MLNRTPTEIKLEQKKNEIEIENKLESCCFFIDKRMVVLITKIIITVCVIPFCLYQLHISLTCEDKNLYQNILIIFVSHWLSAII